MKRSVDIVISLIGLLISAPLLLPVIIIIWLQDFRSPFYIAPRVGKNGRDFKMVKLRSMVVGADRTGVDSTSNKDPRITPIGKFIRAYKLDEISQLWNVLIGDMSLVGPRPNVRRAVEHYMPFELHLLSVRPGITDISSIVFSDEGDILKESKDPDLDYDRLIRPWKSRLGVLYVENQSFRLDFLLVVHTVIAIFSRKRALIGIGRILRTLRADETLIRVASRTEPLLSFPATQCGDGCPVLKF